ncbi:MAG: hypothetical protein V5B34_07660 [Accumulibacter sp.]|jgi:hypothetical protein
MNAALNRRLSKVEEISARSEIGTEVDRYLERMGTSRAEMLADFGSLAAFRDWLAAGIAATDGQAGVTIATRYRQRQVDRAVSEKWDAIVDQHEVLQ